MGVAAPRGAAKLLLAAGLCAAVPHAAAKYTCDEPWPDFCNGTASSAVEAQPPQLPETCNSGLARRAGSCSAYAPPLQPDVDWLAVRGQLVDAIFRLGGGRLPAGEEPLEFKEAPCSEFGDCPEAPGAIVRRAVWEISVRVNASFVLALNSTGFLSPADSAPLDRETLVIYHSGHYPSCDRCAIFDDDGVIQWLNGLGYDVMHLQMPLFMCNYVESMRCDHSFFKEFEEAGAPTMRFFLEPVVLAVNFALGKLGYKRVFMTGLSGGGWTTTMLPAFDPRISLSQNGYG